MVAPSKIFDPPICFNHCSQSILHPGMGCLRSFLIDLAKNSMGGLQYFSPLLITPLVLKFKTMNRQLFFATLKYYLETVICTTMAGASSFLFICCFRNVLGRFNPYTTLFVPTCLGMQFCWFFPTKVMTLFATATSQSVFECLLRQHKNPITHLLWHSKSLQTIIFMLNSAIILHYQRLKVYKGFWFIKPLEHKTLVDEVIPFEKFDHNANYIDCNGIGSKKCLHFEYNNVTCSKFIWNGIKSYMYYGIPLDLLSTIMRTRVPKEAEGILHITWEKLKKFRPNMTGFFIMYSGVYRLSSCLLRKYYGHLSEDLQHILAAFLGGSSFWLMDKVSFVTLSTVIAVQAMWQQFCNKSKSSSMSKENKYYKGNQNLALKLLRELPFSRILFALNMGYLVHNYILNYEIINSLARGFLDKLTSNKIRNIHQIIEKNSMEDLKYFGRNNPVKYFL